MESFLVQVFKAIEAGEIVSRRHETSHHQDEKGEMMTCFQLRRKEVL